MCNYTDGIISAVGNDAQKVEICDGKNVLRFSTLPVVTFQNLGRANELAGALTIDQRHKLSAIIEFLQSVAFFSEIATRDRDDFVRGVVRSQKEDNP